MPVPQEVIPCKPILNPKSEQTTTTQNQASPGFSGSILGKAPAFRFERSQNYALIREIIANPRAYRAAMDDFAPAPEDYRPPENDLIWYVLAFEGEELLGLFALVAQNPLCWELHHALLPGKWIPQGKAALPHLVAWTWENVRIRADAPAQRIVVPVYLKFRTREANTIAMDYVRDAGFTEWGRNPKSWQRRGRLVDQVWFGITR